MGLPPRRRDRGGPGSDRGTRDGPRGGRPTSAYSATVAELLPGAAS
jgi:hypothetical protein